MHSIAADWIPFPSGGKYNNPHRLLTTVVAARHICLHVIFQYDLLPICCYYHLRIVGYIADYAFYGNAIKTLVFPAGYVLYIYCMYVRTVNANYHNLLAVPYFRLSFIGSLAFFSNQLTSVTFKG